MLVVSWNDLTDARSNAIKTLVDTITRMFDDFRSVSFDTIRDSLFLVITKVPEGNGIDEIKDELMPLLYTKYFEDNKIAGDIIRTLSESSDKISIFSKQSIPGEVDFSDRGEILRILHSTEFVPSSIINPPVSQESQLKIHGVFEALKNHIGELITTLMKKYIEQNTIIAESISSESELINSFESFKLAKNKFEHLLNLANSERITEIIDSFAHNFPNECEELKKNFVALEFCQQVKQDLPIKDVIIRIKEIIHVTKASIDQNSTEIEGVVRQAY